MIKKDKLKVGVAQIAPKLADLQANTQKHLDFIKKAHKENIELLLFPELSLTGYSLNYKTPAVAIDLNSCFIKELAEAAGDMAVCFGIIEEASLGEYYNTQIIVKNGKVIHRHQKINLPNYGGLEEAKWYSKGQSITPCKILPHVLSHTLICADLWNPCLTHIAMLDKPDILLAPINSALNIVSDDFSNESGWKTNTDFISMTYGIPLLMANSCAREGEHQFFGGSKIINPFGECIAQATNNEELIFATLDFQNTKVARFQLPTIRDADSLLTLKLLKQKVERSH